MSTVSTTDRRSPGLLAVVVAALGTVVLGYGVLVIPVSPLAGVWLAVAGLFLLIAGVVATPWAAARFDLTPREQRTTALVFGGAGFVLLALFVVVSFASFESGSSSSSAARVAGSVADTTLYSHPQ